ncbi:hypothetical protein GGI23_005146, partial [Coemansia sp. RSA 2559]
MSLLDVRAAAQVCKIATALATKEQHILVTSPLQHARGTHNASRPTTLLGSALATLFQTPTQALAHTLFGASGGGLDAAHNHLYPLQSSVLEHGHTPKQQAMVWLSWDDCRCLVRVFTYFEYVDAMEKPTSLVDTLVSRLTAGEAAKSPPIDRPPPDSSASRNRSSASGGVGSAVSGGGGGGSGGASRLWSWGASGNSDGSGNRGEENNGSAATMMESEEH